jgi:hypothetical protein
MIIAKVNNINKLVGCIKIMSLLENVELGGPQKIMSIGLLNNVNNVRNLDTSSKFALV